MAEQLAFGAPFAPTPQDAQKAAALVAGTLDLPPNKTWRMPAEITWYENPFKEPNWVAQFHMLRWIDPLRRQAEKGNVALLDLWLHIAEGWIEKNPPGRGRANYSWADMIEAARAMTFAFALPVLEDHHPEKLPIFLDSLEQHGEWLAEEKHIRTGNHALQQHQGLLVIGTVLERPEWVELAVQRAEQMLHESYDDQGINEEGAVQYHQINFLWWNALGKRVQIATGSTPDAFQRVAKAPLAMAHATRPDGRYELIGDTEEFTPRALGHPAIDYVSSAGAKGIPHWTGWPCSARATPTAAPPGETRASASRMLPSTASDSGPRTESTAMPTGWRSRCGPAANHCSSTRGSTRTTRRILTELIC
ncbi:hypothetical protein H3H54_14440 [Brachybacterium sp. Z12]|uniref:heparinase II/III family protein n=1 Tax=Brachybacterium sp. Z12 TaxID=2759167 RepID=UPI001860D915|nr:hypothetical protein H3H54_14440 [Brachybacterium sp. Z12]